MSTVGLVIHHGRDSAARVAGEVAAALVAEGHEVRIPIDDAEVAGLGEHGVALEDFPVGIDVAVSLGGDGTMLRTVEIVAEHDVPVIGVNLGQLGYLTEIEPSAVGDSLRQFFAGAYQIEERMLLEVTVDAPSGGITIPRAVALNEAVLEKTLSGHTVRLDVAFDGVPFTPYATDGLIVATPTGSTAYAFSARGPIIAPSHDAILLTPVSPHMLFDRSLVLDATSEVRVRVDGHRPAVLTVDGRLLGEMREGDSITCTAASSRARLVRFSPRDFLQILKSKFGLHDR